MYAFAFKIPLDALQQRTEQFLIPSKKDLSERNFSGFLMRIKLSSRKIIGTSPHLDVPSKRMIPIVEYLHDFLQNTYCCREATIPALLSTESLEMKGRAIC